MSAIEEVQREIAETQRFVEERFDPLRRDVELSRQEGRDHLLGRQTNDRLRVRDGKLSGYDLVDLAIMRSLMRAQKARPMDYDPRALQAWEESVQKAMDATTAGAGDELVSTEEARQLWNDVNLETAVASLFETVNMPTNPFEVPLQLGDVNWYPGTANLATTSTNLATAKQTLNGANGNGRRRVSGRDVGLAGGSATIATAAWWLVELLRRLVGG